MGSLSQFLYLLDHNFQPYENATKNHSQWAQC